MRAARPILLSLLMLAATDFSRGAEPKASASAIRQAGLKQAFESFRLKLGVLAGRMETSADPRDKERARSLRAALKAAGERGVEGKFESLIRALGSKGADLDLDLLAAVAQENKELRADLKALLALITADGRDETLKKRADEIDSLRAKLKDIRSRQARLQARAEKGADAEAMRKAQGNLAEETREAMKDPAAGERVQKPLARAADKQGQAGKALGERKPGPAGAAMGDALDALDEAIRELEAEAGETRREREDRKLRDLLARVKRMLRLQVEIRDGIGALCLDILKAVEGKPTLAHSARSNKLSDVQTASLAEAVAGLKLLLEQGDAVAFVEVFEQVKRDMESLQSRLDATDTGTVSQRIADDLVDTLREMAQALEKRLSENKPPMPPPGGTPGTPGPPGPLVTKLQQLKLIHAMQKRVNARTALHGTSDGKELADLARRQERIRKVTSELGKPE